MRIFVVTHEENYKFGGTIVLNELARILSQYVETYTLPIMDQFYEASFSGVYRCFLHKSERAIRRFSRRHAHIFDKGLGGDEDLIIYPETVLGNPYKFKNVARLYLHKPGFHRGILGTCNGELSLDYNNFLCPPWKQLYETYDEAIYFVKLPLDRFECEGQPRDGVAYVARHSELTEKVDGTCINEMSMDEISCLFKRIKTFISYDLYTAFSQLASYAGADSVVIPKEGLSIDAWLPETQRHGVAYGFKNVEWCRGTREMLRHEMRSINGIPQFDVSKLIAALERHCG